MFDLQRCKVLVQKRKNVMQQREQTGRVCESLGIMTLACALALALVATAARAQNGRILGVQSHGADLRVLLEWSAEADPATPVNLGIKDLFGGEIEHVLTLPKPGQAQEVVAPGLLAQMLQGGQHYEIHLAPSEGGGALAPEVYPFALELRCKTPTTCRVGIRGGISAADSLLVSREISEALDGMEKAGVENLLEAVLTEAPQLSGDVYNLAWQHRYLAGRYSSQQQGCECFWETVAVHLNDFCEGDCGAAHAFILNVDSSISFGGGATHAAAETPEEPEIRTFTIPGSSELTVDIRCGLQTGSSMRSLEVRNGGWSTTIELEIPTLSPCPGACISSIQHQVTYDAAQGANSVSGVGTVHDEAIYQLDGVTLFDVDWILSTPVGGGAVASVYSTSASGAAVSGSTSHLSTSGTIDLQATSGAATGWIESGFTMQATAVSNCTGPGLLEVSTAAMATASEGEELTIIIGDCHGGG